MYSGADDEQPASVLFFKGFVLSGSDIQVTKIPTSERTGGHLDDGEFDFFKLLGVPGIVTANRSPVAEGHPEVVIFIDCHAIG